MNAINQDMVDEFSFKDSILMGDTSEEMKTYTMDDIEKNPSLSDSLKVMVKISTALVFYGTSRLLKTFLKF